MDSKGKQRTIRIGIWVAILGLLLGVLGTIITATVADAHAALTSVSPKDGSSLATAPAQVILTFSEAISTSFATVTVTGVDGEVAGGKTVVQGATVTRDLAPDLADGRYTVVYRVVSQDGHPVSDKTTFTVAASTTPTASGGPSVTPPSTAGGPAAASPAPRAHDDVAAAGKGRGLRIGLAAGVAALALAGGTALVASGRRRTSE